MTVNEMIERLQEVAEEGMGEFELRLAFQPGWPLQFEVGGLATPEETRDEDGRPEVVYLVEGAHPEDTPYAPQWAFENASL
jgi:hypothetical protein